jgi:hypothetical protein
LISVKNPVTPRLRTMANNVQSAQTSQSQST